MSKVTHREQDKMRYTMKTNARRALKTRYGQEARDLADQLIHQDEIGFYIVEKEVLAAVKAAKEPVATAPAPTSAPAPAVTVLRSNPNPVVVKAALEALEEQENVAKNDWPELSRKVTIKPEIKELFEMPKTENPKAAPATKDAKAARCTFKNGARKPLKGKTAEVWAMGDKLLAELGRTPELKEMKAAMPAYNGTTVAIQFYAWRKYNGLDA